MNSALWKFSLAAAAASFAACASAAPFYETLSWDNQYSVNTRGTPGGFDTDGFGNAFLWNALYAGGSTNSWQSNISDSNYPEQSAALTFSGSSSPVACKTTPDEHVYTTGTYAYSAPNPQTLYLAKYDYATNLNWQINFYDSSQPNQVPIALDSDANNNAHLAVRITDNIMGQSYLNFLKVNPTSSIVYWYGADQSIIPTAAKHMPNRWFVTGTHDSTVSELGRAVWGIYDETGGRLAQGAKDSNYLDGQGDYVKYSYLIAPAPDESFLVVENATYHYVSDATKPTTFHTVYLYSKAGGLLANYGTSGGNVVSAVNQGSTKPTYFFEIDGATGQSVGTPTLYAFTTDHMILNWKREANAQTILPDSTGLFTVGTNATSSQVYLFRFDTSGNLVWSNHFAGNQSGGKNYPVAASAVNQKLYVESLLSYTTGQVVDARRYIPGPALTTAIGGTVSSGGTIQLRVNLNEPATGTMTILGNLGTYLTIGGKYHTFALYLQAGDTYGIVNVQAINVTSTKTDVVTFNQDSVVRKCTVTVNP